QADLQGKDRRFDAVERLIEIAPEGDSAKEGGNCAPGGFGTAAVPDSLEIHLIGHVPTVARLDVVERPCDDDPPQFSKLGVQLSLELVADLGSQLGPAEADDQAADLGEHRDQANGQWQQGGRKMRCREKSEASSMIHRGALSGRVTGSVPSVTSQERRLSFKSPELIQGGTQATPRVKTARISWKSLALARQHPVRPRFPGCKEGGRTYVWKVGAEQVCGQEICFALSAFLAATAAVHLKGTLGIPLRVGDHDMKRRTVAGQALGASCPTFSVVREAATASLATGSPGFRPSGT